MVQTWLAYDESNDKKTFGDILYRQLLIHSTQLIYHSFLENTQTSEIIFGTLVSLMRSSRVVRQTRTQLFGSYQLNSLPPIYANKIHNSYTA